LRGFEPSLYDPSALRAHAEAFGPERFVSGLKAIVERVRSNAR